MSAKPKLLFPSALVIQARFNSHLQQQHRPADAQARYCDMARSCPSCGCPPTHLLWIYFRSDAWAWRAGCGTGGWLTLCDACDAHIDYFVEEVSEQGQPEPIRLHPHSQTPPRPARDC
jgi:hypothetical protein